MIRSAEATSKERPYNPAGGRAALDLIAQWLYLAGAVAGIGLGAVAWTVNALRLAGALALLVSLFALGEAGFLLTTGISSCSALIGGECIDHVSSPWLAALGVVVLGGAVAGLLALRPSLYASQVRVLFGAAGVLTLGAVLSFGLDAAFVPALAPPAVFAWLAWRGERLRHAR